MNQRLLAAVLAAGALLALPAAGQAASPDVVISEVYGGGGNSGAMLTHDYIELYNRGPTAVPVNGWTVQYASAGGTSWQRTTLTGTIEPGRNYLIREAQGSGGSVPLPEPDASGSIPMSATGGKVALVPTTTLCQGASCANLSVRDFVGFGGANAFEGTGPTPAPSNTTSVKRKLGGSQDTDDNRADFTAGSPDPRNHAGEEPEVPPGEPTRIHDIQGAGHRSPVVARQVDVSGVVTAIRGNGFYIQDPDEDGDPRTSEGLFVFGRQDDADVVVGSPVVVTGPVSEFRPGGDSGGGLTITEVTAHAVKAGTGADEIVPALIGPGELEPPQTVIEDDASDVETNGVFDPTQDGIDFHEALEGMLVEIAQPEATGPTNDFGELSVLAGGAGGPFTPRGGVYITPLDFNPERLILDDEVLFAGGLAMPKLNTGDGLVGSVRAVVDYSFGNFKYHVTEEPVRDDNGLQREVTEEPRANQIAMASMNVENLDPTDPPSKFSQLAGILVDNLRSPDLVALEEVQDNDGAEPEARDTTSTDATLTYQAFIAAIQAAGGPRYEFAQINPEDNQDGGEPEGNIRVGFLYRTDRGLELVDRGEATATTANGVEATRKGAALTYSPGRIDPTNPAFNNSRKPLAAEFEWRGRTVFAIANHFNSKGGDQPLFGRFQPPARSTELQRHEQARAVRAFVEEILEADPRAAVAVLGDLNDFEFSETLEILEGGGLVNLMETLPENERYSYVFDGNSQVLDQILVSHELLTPAPEYDSVHVNAEFADQASDHDPQVARVVVRGTGNAGD